MALNSPGPDINFPFVNPNGTLTRTGFELLLSIFTRTGGSDGGDLSALKTLIDEALAAIASNESEIQTLFGLDGAQPQEMLALALMARVVALESGSVTLASVTRPPAAAQIDAPIAIAQRAPADLPESVAVPVPGFLPAFTTAAPTAGSAGALPATPAGYASILIGGVPRTVAFY